MDGIKNVAVRKRKRQYARIYADVSSSFRTNTKVPKQASFIAEGSKNTTYRFPFLLISPRDHKVTFPRHRLWKAEYEVARPI